MKNIKNKKTGLFPVFLFIGLFIVSFAHGFETQGLWVVRGTLASKANIDNLINFAHENHYTDLFAQVRGRGDAYYASNFVVSPQGRNFQNFDPLAYLIIEAHRKNIKVHAWINAYLVWSRHELPIDENHLANKHQEWLDANFSGNNGIDELKTTGKNGNEGLYLSPTHPEVNQYILAVVDEIISKYDVDGIHYDYIRYHDSQYGFSRGGRKSFLLKYQVDPLSLFQNSGSYWFRMSEEESGKVQEKWNKFRESQITDLVLITRNMLKNKAPKVLLSAAVKPNIHVAKTRYFQNWPLWLQYDLLDFVVPMNYAKETPDFENNIFLYQSAGIDFDKIYMGVATYNQSNSSAADKIRATRRRGFKNIVIFSYDTHLDKPQYFKKIHKAFKY